MPEVIIKFNLPEEGEEYRITSRAIEYYSSLHTIRECVRQMWKYGHNFKTIEDAIETIYEMICEECDD